jgi:hypothetical protein
VKETTSVKAVALAEVYGEPSFRCGNITRRRFLAADLGLES